MWKDSEYFKNKGGKSKWKRACDSIWCIFWFTLCALNPYVLAKHTKYSSFPIYNKCLPKVLTFRTTSLCRILPDPVWHRDPWHWPGDGRQDTNWHLFWRHYNIVSQVFFISVWKLSFCFLILLKNTFASFCWKKKSKCIFSVWAATRQVQGFSFALSCTAVAWSMNSPLGP